jgi:hypothetical protein
MNLKRSSICWVGSAAITTVAAATLAQNVTDALPRGSVTIPERESPAMEWKQPCQALHDFWDFHAISRTPR